MGAALRRRARVANPSPGIGPRASRSARGPHSARRWNSRRDHRCPRDHTVLGLHLATGRGPALQPDFSVDAGQRLDRDSAVAGVITGSEPSWIAPFAGLSPRVLGKPVTALRREGVDPVRNSRPWSLPLDDRVLLVVTYWRTNLTLRQLDPLFGISKSAADRIIDHLGPLLALQPRRGSARTLCSSWTAPLRPPASPACSTSSGPTGPWR